MNSRDPVEGLWAGVPVYLCPLCAFDSEQREKTVAHIADAHPVDPEIVIPVTTTKAKPKEKLTDG